MFIECIPMQYKAQKFSRPLGLYVLCLIIIYLCKECYLQNRPVLTYFDMVNDLSRLKKEHSWLKAVDSRALQNSLKLLRDTGKKYYGKTMDVLTVHYKRKNSPVTRYKSTCKGNKEWQGP